MDQISLEIRSCIANILGINEDEININDHFVNNLGGDSLALLDIVTMLESKFNISLSDIRLKELVSIAKLECAIKEKMKYNEETSGNYRSRSDHTNRHRVGEFLESMS